MKKLKLFAVSVTAMIFFLTSCQKEGDLIKPIEKNSSVKTDAKTGGQTICQDISSTPFGKRMTEIEKSFKAKYNAARTKLINENQLEDAGVDPEDDFDNESFENALSGKIVLMLDFNGNTVVNTAWNLPGQEIICPSVMQDISSQNRQAVLERVQQILSPWKVQVKVNNESALNSASYGMRMIVCKDMGAYLPASAGLALNGSLLWQNGTPGFIQADLLQFDVDKLAFAICHEWGHTVGLNHQSLWANGQLVYEYHPNIGQPWNYDYLGVIIGAVYNSAAGIWFNGTDQFGNPQNDVAVFNCILGKKPDDAKNNINKAKLIEFGKSYKKLINNFEDVDFFEVNKKNFKLTVQGYNTDLLVKVYNNNKQLIGEFDPAGDVSIATTQINSNVGGKCYISVETSKQQSNFTANAGTIRGQYVLSTGQ